MIYITGDTHIPIDVLKLSMGNFPEQKQLTKNDFVIICGDFGGVWNNSKEEIYWRDWLNKKNFTTLFVKGNHENHSMLNKYPIKKWNGGEVHFICDSVIHLMCGQVFIIDGLKFFTMGGAESIVKQDRVEGKSWWKEELPSDEEYNEALNNLDKCDWNVDYVLSHTCSTKTMENICYIKERNKLNSFFDALESELNFKRWYFGHFHKDLEIDDKHTVVYNKIIKLEVNKIMKIGDKVKIREDLVIGGTYGEDSVVKEMLEFRGKETFICDESDHGYFLNIDDQAWCWTAEMLILIKEEEENNKEYNTVLYNKFKESGKENKTDYIKWLEKQVILEYMEKHRVCPSYFNLKDYYHPTCTMEGYIVDCEECRRLSVESEK